jgi:hypothetical protein
MSNFGDERTQLSNPGGIRLSGTGTKPSNPESMKNVSQNKVDEDSDQLDEDPDGEPLDEDPEGMSLDEDADG